MMMPKKALYLMGVLFAISIQVFAQQFPKSKGMALFNRASYDSAITEIKAWIVNHPEEEDVASYYLAESYYNLAMSEPLVGKSRDHFRQAFKLFQKVSRSSFMKTRYPKIYYSTQLKTGWCYFRRAETGEQPDVELDHAYLNFLRVDPEAPDSILLHSYLMAGESRYREGTVRQINAMSQSFTLLDLNKLLSAYRDATRQYKKVLASPVATPLVKLVAEVRLNDIQYQLGKLYLTVPAGLFAEMVDEHKKSTPGETALAYLRGVDYLACKAAYPEAKNSPFQDFLNYSEAMKWLNIYFITFRFEDKRKFLNLIRDVHLAELDKEIRFRQGCADHNTNQIDDNENFFNLYQNDQRSFYFQALPQVKEAYFWLGTVQFIANQNTGIDNLHTFVQNYASFGDDPRISTLLDYARYWRGMLFLEKYRRQPQRLQELERFLGEFKPKGETLQFQLKQLEKLTKMELGEDVWQQVLQGEASTDWFAEAISIIQYLLRRAATVVAEDRLHYLQQVRRIFRYTGSQRSNETAFYQGIATSLEAEIQGDEQDKRDLFQQSADLLSTVEAPYRLEADYIRGRSLFFAERYDEAKEIFRRLINENKSLRSLYYFAEILRQAGAGDAAKSCFEVIKQKTRNNPEGKFWYLNAEAAINLCVNKKDGSSELIGLNYQDVGFPDQLFEQSYEQLADRKFVRFQYLQESLQLLKKYALPKKTVYLASSSPLNSIFKPRGMEALPAILDEILRRETSVLDIFVLLPEPSGTPAEIKINEKEAEKISESHYRSSVFSVGDHISLSIQKDKYYGYQQEFDITTPGKQPIIIPLTEKVQFQPLGTAGVPVNFVSFPERLDRNIVIQSGGAKFPADSPLLSSFASAVHARDMAFHPTMKNYLVVDSQTKKGLRRFDPSGNPIEEEAVFPLQFQSYDLQEIKEPEGIAVDQNGNIYLTDFASHRVVVFDSLGKYKYYFGGFGRNTEEDRGKRAKFVFPTRIAIEEDHQGFEATMNGKKTRVFRMPFLLVADRYGIHRCDLEGHFIETVLHAGEAGFKAGSLYAFGVDHYGIEAKLILGVREKNRFVTFMARPLQ